MDHDVVLVCSELTSGMFLEFVLEALTRDYNVGVLRDWSRTWIHSVDTVRSEAELTHGP